MERAVQGRELVVPLVTDVPFAVWIAQHRQSCHDPYNACAVETEFSWPRLADRLAELPIGYRGAGRAEDLGLWRGRVKVVEQLLPHERINEGLGEFYPAVNK